MGEPIKVAVLTNIPTPYRTKFWEAYAGLPGVTFHVYYCCRMEPDRAWAPPRSSRVAEFFLPGVSLRGYWHVNPSVCFAIQRYDLWLIGGYSMPTVQFAVVGCRLTGTPYVLLIDGISPKRLSKAVRGWKARWKKWVARGAIAVLATGRVGREYALRLGVPADRIYNQYLTVDVDWYRAQECYREDWRQEVRSRHGVYRDDFLLVYVGRLVAHKGVDVLIKAVHQLRLDGYPVSLLVVGGGRDSSMLRLLAKDMPEVRFVGPVEACETVKFYYAADVFVLPTYDDPWGLAINEAMACGLPVITTSAAGAASDLVTENNGMVVEPGDVAGLRCAIQKYLDDRTLLDRHREGARAIIQGWTYRAAASEWSRLLRERFAVPVP